MADKSTLEQMLENLVNDNQEKAEELFHEYVVSKSREIYENLIEEEMKDEEVDETSDNEDEAVDEASKDDDAAEDKVDEASDDDAEDKVDEATDEDEVKEDSKDEEVDEEFEDVAIEGEDDMPDMGGDPTDDLESEVDADSEEEGEKEPAELFQDLDSIVDELQAKFDEIKGDEGEGDMDSDMDSEEAFAPETSETPEVDELDTFREYVEKVAGGHGAEKKGAPEGAESKKSVVDNMKNDMGGTTANIAKGGEDSGKNDGGLADITPKDIGVNDPKAAAKGAFKEKTAGHGAEKKGAGESADNKQSIFRSKR